MREPRAPEFFAKDVSDARRFYYNLAAGTGRALRVVAGGVEHCGSTYRVDRISFPFPTIEYVARGHGELQIAGQRLALDPGSVFAYREGMPHCITSCAHGQLVKYFVAFAGGNTRRFLDRCGLSAGQLVQLTPADALTGLLEELIWAGMRADQGSQDYCRRILECLAVRIKASMLPAREPKSVSFLKYQTCRDFIERSFLNLQNAQGIAQGCDISEVHLCHLFRRYDHETPHRLLTRLKMTHAAALIQQSSALVRQVAEAVGYSDQFHFSRVFRSVMGVPPSEWRRMNQRPVGEK
jgi:AraC-like DNA-binding protein